MTIKRISILGCGWLGLPLGRFLAEKKFEVKGSTTHKDKLDELFQAGISPYLVKLDPYYSGNEIEAFLDSDLLIINIPPSLRTQSEEFHILQMKEVFERLKKSPVKYLIYISSTSVYPDLNQQAKEDEILLLENAGNKTLLQAEEIFRNEKNLQSLIVRCAGLAGDDRNLTKYFAGKENLKMGNAPVNLIHREDVIGVLYELIKSNTWGETINICAPIHPLRKDLYPFLAQKYGFITPHYDSLDNTSFKIINIDKLMSIVNYQFKFPDPHHFFYNS
jgi:nucleoside-diphosphate-sugar epimerase